MEALISAERPNGTEEAEVSVRDSSGRWVPGNKAGVGHGGGAKDLARWRRVALEATTDEDMIAVWGKLIKCAKDGEAWAVHEFLDRTMGKARVAPVEASQDTGALMARLWQEWASPRRAIEAGGRGEAPADQGPEPSEGGAGSAVLE